jgi:hypothetical protein
VDSAEADKVGSRGFRFCAYAVVLCGEGVRYYRATLGAVNFLPGLLGVVGGYCWLRHLSQIGGSWLIGSIK